MSVRSGGKAIIKRTKTPAMSKSATTKRKLQLGASQEFQQHGQTKKINQVSATLNTTIDSEYSEMSGVLSDNCTNKDSVNRPNNTQVLDPANMQQRIGTLPKVATKYINW